MTVVLRTWTLGVACFFSGATPVASQIVARSTYLGEGSFELPLAGSMSPQQPNAIAVGPDGSTHIVDQLGQVVVFDPTGTPVRSYGSGVLRKPLGVAIDEAGTPYVLDGDLKQVKVFDREGGELYAIGGPGRGPAQLDDPVGLALGPRGFVYVLDKGRSAVRIFGRDGLFVRQLPLGSNARNAIAIAVGGDGRIFVVDRDGGPQVFSFPPFPDLPWTVGPGPEVMSLGPVEEASSIAVDGFGTAVVVDRRQGRIWGGDRLDPAVATQSRPLYGGTGTGRGSFREPVGIAFTPERHLVILDRELRKVERVELTEGGDAAALQWEYPVRVSQLPPNMTSAVMAVGPGENGAGRFIVTAAGGRSMRMDEGTVERFVDFHGDEFDAHSLPVTPDADGFSVSFRRDPGAVALNDSLLVVTEPDEDRFAVFDLRDGSTLGTFGRDYDDDRRLNKPVGVAFFSDGSLVVADRDNHRVAVFSADLASLLGVFPLQEAWGVAVSPQGQVFAWSERGLTVVRIPLDGGPQEALPGALVPGPVQDITFDAHGNLLVLEKRSSRVTVLDSNLERVLVRLGGNDPQFAATHLTVDDSGNIYVSSLKEGRTHVYRWDLQLPELEGVRVVLTSGGADLSWGTGQSDFLGGYQVLGAATEEGPFATSVTLESASLALALEEGSEMRWLRVAPVSIAGSAGVPTPPIPLVRRLASDASARSAHGEVLNIVAQADALEAAGVLSFDADVAREVEWYAFLAEFELGRFEEAMARKEALEDFRGDDGGVDLHRRLTIVHANLGHQAPALASARRAVEIMSPQQRSTEDGIELLRLGLVAASETGAHEAVLAFGDGLQEKVAEDREWNTGMRIAAAQLALANPQGALQIALEILDRDRAGTILAYEGERPNLFWIGFQGALQLGDPGSTELWAAEVAPYVEGGRRQEYYRALSRFRLSQGQGSQAHSDLMEIVQPTTDPAFFSEVETIGLTLDLFRVLQDGDVEEHTAGLTFLAQYTEGLPTGLGDLQAAYRDSIASFTVREGIRARLGEGFQYWRDANFVQMIRFFEQTLETGGLEQEQKILARGFLASAYLSAGRREDAEAAYRAILELNPLFDIDAIVEEVQALYDVTLFDAQTIAVFREVRRIR